MLRRYYDTRMMMAESDGLTIRDYRTFWMEHKGDIEHTYTVNKALSKDVIEKMRDGYGKAAEKYLTTVGKKEEVTRDEMLQKMNRQFLMLSGFSAAEVDELGDPTQKSEPEMQELVRKRQMQSLGLNGNGRQKVVTMMEVRKHILDGWEFVQQLPTGEAIIRLPEK